MGAYEQKKEKPDDAYQYVLFAAEPYETIGFKIPSTRISKDEGAFFTHWDAEKQTFTVQFKFMPEAQ